MEAEKKSSSEQPDQGPAGSSTSTPPTTMQTESGTKQKWTPGELDVLEAVAEEKGWEYAEKYAERILAYAQPFIDD